ncbi:MAG: 30S ribosomal protein S9 [Candidatus Magasanikbacteria bacterium RIFOXYD2_FULL_41_14]|uniref:Small ribosomal subunit protein uS9 n=1 Tax=Candidatus Magasanikbacteria bacterium RIFOXYD2_FULL_41_14 TaxID=1798709 RepID=A0A1F6PFR8_9BACT|nr:MAG: 30S ribosomal protein S9 [Candidatus Magasanikbacteria bacterium RIFOXYD2_FULL_41_14]
MVKLTKSENVVKRNSVGRRKRASARVRLDVGEGNIVVNGMPYDKYFPFFEQRDTVLAPLKAVAREKNYNISIKVVGGGKKGQADAVRLGIARALLKWDAELRKTLKSLGFLTRDSRIKERKKFGLKKARRAPQWSKR